MATLKLLTAVTGERIPVFQVPYSFNQINNCAVGNTNECMVYLYDDYPNIHTQTLISDVGVRGEIREIIRSDYQLNTYLPKNFDVYLAKNGESSGCRIREYSGSLDPYIRYSSGLVFELCYGAASYGNGGSSNNYCRSVDGLPGYCIPGGGGAYSLPRFLVFTSQGELCLITCSTYIPQSSNPNLDVLGISLDSITMLGVTENNLDVESFDPTEEDDFMNRFNPRTQTSLIGSYVLTKSELNGVMSNLWTTDIFEELSNALIGDGSSALQGCRFYYGIRPYVSMADVRSKIVVAAKDLTDSYHFVANKEFVLMDMGTINVTAYYGDFRDYSNTSYKMFIPFVGLIDLDPNDVVGYDIQLEYRVNITDGSALVHLTRVDGDVNDVIFSTATQYGYEVPLQVSPSRSAGSWVANVLRGGGTSLVSGVEYSVGSFTENTGAMGGFTPYLAVYRQTDLSDTDVDDYKGKPSNTTRQMSEFTGYVEIADVLNGGTIPTRRMGEIVNMLKGGVYL